MKPGFPILIGFVLALGSALFALSKVRFLDPGPHLKGIGC
jgi:hypothetical protein